MSEVEVFYRLHQAGLAVLIPPFSDNLRYDCIVDDGAQLSRVQVKTGHVSAGCVEFSVCRTDWYRRVSYSYHGQADCFGVWCPQLCRVYMVPVGECGKSVARLRLEPPKNGQRRKIRWAAAYELHAGWRARYSEVKERPYLGAPALLYNWRAPTGLTKVNCGLTL